MCVIVVQQNQNQQRHHPRGWCFFNDLKGCNLENINHIGARLREKLYCYKAYLFILCINILYLSFCKHLIYYFMQGGKYGHKHLK